MRRIAFIAATLATWTAVLLWAAGASWTGPVSPAVHLTLPGSQFRVVIGGGAIDEAHLRVGAVGADQSALQSIALSGLDAADYPVLRYRFEHFPRTLELSFVFRRADAPDDVQVISLPWPDDADAAFDLGDVPEWHGRITEIGFAEYPTPQLVPPELGFKPFTLRQAELWSPSWRGDLAALVTDWFAHWPWSQRSVHALGRDTDTPRARSPVLAVSIAIVANALLAFALLGLRGRQFLFVALIGAATGWVLLDVRWLSGLWWRHVSTRELYASRSWDERQRLVADSDLAALAARVQTVLRSDAPETRVLVYSDSSYSLLRLVYHLLPRNAAAFTEALATGARIPPGTVLVFYDAAGWQYDAARRALVGGATVPAVLLLDENGLMVLRVRGGAVRP